VKEFEDLYELVNNLVQIKDRTNEENCLNLLQSKLNEIKKIRLSLSSADEKLYKESFRQYKDLIPILHQCPFGKYVNDKPRGYPGDFITQEMIILGRKYPEHRYIGDTPIAKLLSSLTYNMSACAANDFRLKYIQSQIRQSGESIASIGSGSSIEFWDMEEDFLSTRQILLIDQDSGALESAKNHIKNTSNNFIFHQDNILKFILCDNKRDFCSEIDFIYLLGLLDYFPIKHSTKIVSNLWKNIKPNGKLLLTNAHPSNPTRLWMEYVSEWYLDYKSKDEIFQIVENLIDVNRIDYAIDEFGVYQYLTVYKN
jgi:ubiquinone/menaquinone biosynthesis C-methylase UbiE